MKHGDVERAYDQGRQAWPSVPLSFAVFRDAFERHAQSSASKAALHGADLYLATACAGGESEALRSFEARYGASIERTIASVRSDGDFVAEARQQLRVRLLLGEDGGPPRIAKYSARGALKGWVNICAARIAVSLARRAGWRLLPEDGSSEDLAIARSLDADVALTREEHREYFQRAFNEALMGLATRHRNVLRLRFLDGVNIDGIGAIYRVHRTTAARWVREAREQLLTETRRNLAQRLDLSPSSIDSLVRSLRSELELRVSLLRSQPG